MITSTVAQIASRLLFRGFGISDSSQALAAGLAACDTTICLDEAHLAEPFRQTVEAIRERRREETGAQLGLPGLRAITITATPCHDEDASRVIELEDADRARPDLAQRLTGPKWATLIGPSGTTDRERVEELVAATLAHVRAGADSVACVVNSVRRAREVHKQLAGALGEEEDEPVLALLIGPQRPADRAEFLHLHGPKLFARAGGEARLVCVATQTFEVGLDADVEAMVTESASATALIQRLGRLNRRGDRVGRATIVRDEGSWLYGEDEPAAWTWLREREHDGTVNVSVTALAGTPEPPRPAGPRRAAPDLTEAIVDALACPARSLGAWQDVAVEAFWRPGDERRADVALCWRADLRPALTDRDADGYRATLLELVPPQRAELLTLTINAARAVLAAQVPGAGSAGAAARLALADADVEGETPAVRLPDPASHAPGVPFLVMRGDELWRGALEGGADDVVRPGEIRPGDVIVMPARIGALRAPEVFPRTDVAGDVRPLPSREPDGAERAPALPAPVRITPEALRAAVPDKPLTGSTWREVAARCARVHERLSSARDATARAQLVDDLVTSLSALLPEHGGLGRLPVPVSDPAWHVVLHQLEFDSGGVPVFDPGDDAYDADDEPEVDVNDEQPGVEAEDKPDRRDPTAVGRALETAWVLVPTAAHDRESLRYDEPPTIEAHACAVRAQLERYVERIDLPEPTRAALVLAAAAHDHGKADPRMQAYFRRGVNDFGAKPIAKSTFGTSNPVVNRIARRLSGYPRRWRHEIASVAVLEDALASGRIAIEGISLDALDRPLALDAGAGHHGCGYPLPPVPGEGALPRSFHIDAAGVAGSARGDGQDGWGDGAWLVRSLDVRARYGAWGVTYLEGLLILADRVVSRRGQ